MFFIISVAIIILLILALLALAVFLQYRNKGREFKNYERGLKMVPLLIHLPPKGDDLDNSGRDKRDVVEETISPAEVLFNILASTYTKGFKHSFYGQKHIAMEIIAVNNNISFYIATPVSMIDLVTQAVTSAYPSARVEEVEEHNMFNQIGKIGGTSGGEVQLQKEYAYPIATYKETKQDVMQSLLNSIASLDKQDGVGFQVLLRPAHPDWSKTAKAVASNKRKGGKSSKGFKLGDLPIKQIVEAPFKVPDWGGKKEGEKPKELSGSDQLVVESIESKTQHPGFEVLIRIVASSNTYNRSQSILNNIKSTLALYNSEGRNGFKFSNAKDIERFVTSFIFRFFPQDINKNILNSVELATVFHLPDQRNSATSKLTRQSSKQIEGPANIPAGGQLLGYNLFRGSRREVRISEEDRFRHMYIVGQTGTGKSTVLKNMMIQDMIQGKGFAFISPHPTDPNDVLGMIPKERAKDVIFFNPTDTENPVGLNLFEVDPSNPSQKDFLIQQAISMLYELYDPQRQGMMGARFEQLFRNAALTAMADPEGGTIIDLPKLFVDKEFLEKKLKYVTSPDILEFWRKEMPASSKSNDHGELISWFASKIGAFRTNEMMRNIVGQLKSGINIRKAMDEGKIVIISLDKAQIGDINARLLGMIFLTQFASAALGRSDLTDKGEVPNPFTLYIDEFQNFLVDAIPTILSEARKYKLSVVMANQYIGQLSEEIEESVFGNVGTVISLAVGADDAEKLAKQYQGVFTVDDLMGMPKLNAAVKTLVSGIPANPFTMFVPFPDKNPNLELANALKRLSSARYSTPKGEVEAAIYERMKDDSMSMPGVGAQQQVADMKPKTFMDNFLSDRQPSPQGNATVQLQQPTQNVSGQGQQVQQQQAIQQPTQQPNSGEFQIR